MAISLLLISLLSSSAVLEPNQSSPSSICPEPDVIFPCFCKKACPSCTYSSVIIECSEIHTTDELKAVFEKSPDWTFWNFEITNSTFQYLPAETIDIKRVRHLSLRNTIMFALFDKTPPPTNLLEYLELSNVTLQGGVRWDIFTSLIHLRQLRISNNEIRRIDQKFITNFPVSLTSLFFTNTKTRQLGDTAFAKLNDLTGIFIKKTRISVIQRSMFPEFSGLMAMTFSESPISSLPDDIFTNMPYLITIDFSFTNIVTLKGEAFENLVPRLITMNFEENDIDCGCTMKWVTELRKLPEYLKVTCKKPTRLEGLSMKDLKPNNFLHCE